MCLARHERNTGRLGHNPPTRINGARQRDCLKAWTSKGLPLPGSAPAVALLSQRHFAEALQAWHRRQHLGSIGFQPMILKSRLLRLAALLAVAGIVAVGAPGHDAPAISPSKMVHRLLIGSSR